MCRGFVGANAVPDRPVSVWVQMEIARSLQLCNLALEARNLDLT